MFLISNVLTLVRKLRLIRLANKICRRHKLSLRISRHHDADVIVDIFHKRVYNCLFPFYQDSTIVDIGAHRGYFSIFAQRHAGANSRIHAIEPEEDNYIRLVDNLKNNRCANVTTHKTAISGTTGEKVLYRSNSVNHTLISPDDRPAEKPVQPDSKAVKTLSLHDFVSQEKISEIDLLKMDCEGSEYDILFNAPDHVLDRISAIVLEFHDLRDEKQNIHCLIRHLESKKFKIVNLNFHPTPMPLQMGILTVFR